MLIVISGQSRLLNALLVQQRLTVYPLDRSQGLLEEVIVELLKASSGEWLRQVNTLSQTLHLHTHLMLTGQSTLCTLSLTAQL